MRAIALIPLVLICCPSFSAGQADTAVHRRVYEDVNKRLGSMRSASAKAQRPGVSYVSDLKVWSDGTGVRKIEATDHDDDGDVVREFYYQGGALLFVHHRVMGFNEKGKLVTRVENRHYFRDGAMFKWLGGVEKTPTSPKDKEFGEEAALLLEASRVYLGAAGKPAAKQGSAKAEPTAAAGELPAPAKPSTAIGTFTGIEQGDYAHFNMRLADGSDDSFFVLNDEGGLKAFIEKPEAFVGKKVEVRWVERMENIPEAGGRISVRVALGAKVVR